MRLRFDEKITTKQHVDFGFTDKRERPVGASISTGIMIASEQDENLDWSNHHPNVDGPGEYFGVYIHVTRNGKRFGPLQRTHFFKTKEERKKYINKRLSSMRKRQY